MRTDPENRAGKDKEQRRGKSRAEPKTGQRKADQRRE